MTLGGLLMVGGRLTDYVGCRRMLKTGGVALALAGAASAAAFGAPSFFAARAVAGAAAAIVLPAALTVIATGAASGADRTRALARWSVVAQIGAVCGVLLAGLVTQAGSWRLVFLVDVPLGCAIAITAHAAPEAPPKPTDRPDPISAMALTGALGAAVATIVELGRNDGAWEGRFAAALAALCFITLFAMRERKASTPMVPRDVVASAQARAGNAGLMLAAAAIYGLFLLLSLELQNRRHYSPLHTATALIPLSCGIVFGTSLARRALLGRHVRQFLVSAGLVGLGGFIALAADLRPYVAGILVPSLVAAAGIGALVMVANSAATAELHDTRPAADAALLNTSRQIGGALGIAIMGAVAADAGQALGFLAGGALLSASAVALLMGRMAIGRPASGLARSSAPRAPAGAGSARMAAMDFRRPDDARAT